jgi:hypothetical protein
MLPASCPAAASLNFIASSASNSSKGLLRLVRFRFWAKWVLPVFFLNFRRNFRLARLAVCPVPDLVDWFFGKPALLWWKDAVAASALPISQIRKKKTFWELIRSQEHRTNAFVVSVGKQNT